MVTEISKKSSLLPDRHQQQELFICEIADAVLKDDMASMEHPIFSLSKKPDHSIRTYRHGDVELIVEPSARGIATIYDKDILIYAISKLMKAKTEGRAISQSVVFNAYDFLVFSNRMTNGNAYEGLKDAMSRLDGTRLRTNVHTGGIGQWTAFGLIDGAMIRKSDKSDRVLEWGVKLSDWLFNAIDANEVLTLHPDYFRLRKPLERRVYEIARKHCGRQDRWRVGLDLLQKKCGSTSPKKHFKYMVRELAANDHLPDYAVSYDDDTETVTFNSRGTMSALPSPQFDLPILDPETIHDARSLAPGWDIYELERKWRAWVARTVEEGGGDPPRDPNRAFMGFCRKWYERKGMPQ